ncbi:hypothetical protein [Haloferula sp.]|uniref:hypothetical protein n=1 Tax=Haloferula sp. TaxID=2497595 RepID=UPI003C743D40
MKLKTPSLLMCLLGTALSAHAEFVLAPNGDFSTPGGAEWTAGPSETNGAGPGGGPVFSFPAADGNTGGFAQINLDTGGFAVIFADASVESLGLTAGETYNFGMDMKNLNGPGAVAKLKLEFFIGGGRVSERIEVAPLQGDGSSWATYTFTNVLVPLGIESIRFVPLVDSSPLNIGFDNIGVDNTPVVVDPPPMGDFLAPNGDFSSGNTSWGQDTNVPNAPGVFSYPGGGGSPNDVGGHAAINFITGGTANPYAVIFSDALSLSGLGLVQGETYVFTVDMKNLDGPGRVGKVKFEFDQVEDNDNRDREPDELIGDGGSWQTYEFTVKIPSNASTIKFVPVLAGAGDSNLNIGYDNIGGSNIPVEPPPFVPVQIPNPGFELEPVGVDWSPFSPLPSYISYVEGDTGNPSRFVQLTDVPEEFAELKAFNGAEVTFASLGLAPGDPFSVQVDMKIITPGSDPTSPIGGISVVGPAGFSAPDGFPALIGDGSTWETYTIDFTTPTGAEQNRASFGLVPGKRLSGATVAFDNIQILVAPQAPFTAAIEQGTVVTWEPAGAEFTYQAQKSSDGVTYTDFGPLITGDQVTSSFDAEGAAFYQVVESSLEPFELVTNPGFEDGSNSWSLQGDTPPQLVMDPALADEGNNSMRMAVLTGPTAMLPDTSVLQQAGLGILPTDVLEFSFSANIENRDEPVVMNYSIKWRRENGEVISSADGPIDTPIGVWTQVTRTGLVPPDGTSTAIIEFSIGTGAGPDQSGAVRIDNVSLVVPEMGNSEIIPATSAPGVQVSWPTKSGSSYQPKVSTTLSGFTNLGPVIEGDGTVKTISDLISPPAKFYEIDETP